VIPPNRRTQCATSAAPHASATSTTTGPCHSRGPAGTAAATTATIHNPTTAIGWVPATLAPSELPTAAGTERRHASTAATRPAVTATTTATAFSSANANTWARITTTSAVTPNGPADPSRITSSARGGGP
jgi:hypothetical protein